MNKILSQGLFFLFLLCLQVFILNNINFLGYINPYLYIAFIFLYPLEKNKFPLLFLSFILGISIDFFSDSGGIHAFSILFIAYTRLFFVRVYFRKIHINLTKIIIHSINSKLITTGNMGLKRFKYDPKV